MSGSLPEENIDEGLDSIYYLKQMNARKLHHLQGYVHQLWMTAASLSKQENCEIEI